MPESSAGADSFGRRVLTLAGGTLGAQLVLLAVVPVVTRLYDPADLGLHAIFASLLFVVMALASARYEYAIPLVDDDAQAASLLRLCLGLSLATSALTALVALLGAAPLARALGQPALAPWLLWLPPAVLAGALFQALNYALVRRRAFRAIAGGRLAQAVGTGATWIGAGVAGFVPGGLFVGEVVGRWLSVAVLAVSGRRRDAAPAARVAVREAARRQRRYPLYVLPAALLNLLSVHLPPIVLAVFFSSAVVGWFALAVRLLQAPIRVLGHAVGQVFMASLGTLEGAALAQATRATLQRLARMSLAGGALLMVAAPDAVALVFGAAWRPAGHYARDLAPWLVLVFIGSPLTSLVLAHGRQRAELVFQGALLVARLAALLAGGWLGSAALAVRLFGVVGALAWALYLGALLRLGGVAARDAARVLGVELAIACVAVAPALLVVIFGGTDWLFALALLPAVAVWGVQVVRALRDDPKPAAPTDPGEPSTRP